MDEATQARMQESLDAVKAATPVSITAPRPITNVAAAVANAANAGSVAGRTVEDAFDYSVAVRFAFLGTGQAGGRLTDAFHRIGYRRTAVFNTTENDFEGLSPQIPRHDLRIGGAGKDTGLARQALTGRDEEIRDLLTRAWGPDPDCAFICAGFGGGTGTGTTPQLVRIARKYMADHGRPPRVGAVISLPPRTEGFQVCRNAVLGFKDLLELKVSPLIIIDNARIQKVYSPVIPRLYPTANETVSQYLHLFNKLAAVHSQLITFDRAEFTQLLDSGLVVMGTADIQKIDTPADISTAIRDQLAANVLASVDLATGDKAACLFVADKATLDKMTLDYLDAGFTQLNRILASNKTPDQTTVVHRGLYLGSDPGLQCYVMVGGLGPPTTLLTELAREGGLGGTVEGHGRLAKFLGVQDG